MLHNILIDFCETLGLHDMPITKLGRQGEKQVNNLLPHNFISRCGISIPTVIFVNPTVGSYLTPPDYHVLTVRWKHDMMHPN